MTEHEPPHFLAAARWLEGGSTSATNPVHQRAFDTFFRPFGLACEYLSCDPVSAMAIHGQLALPVLHGVRWDRSQADPDFQVLFPDPAAAHLIALEPLPSGLFHVKTALTIPHEMIGTVDQFAGGQRLNELLGKARHAAARFIYRSFELACLPGADPACTQAFIEDPRKFAELAAELMARPMA